GTVTGSTDTDLTPKETENSKSGNTAPSVNITLGSGSNETSSTNKSDTEDVNLIIKQNMIKAAELFEKYGLNIPVSEITGQPANPQPLNHTGVQVPQMVNVIQPVPEGVKNKDVQQNITIHYDSMINVEGSVDKSFSKEFKKDSDEIYKKITDKLYNEVKMVTGRRPVRRSVL
ncbi:MAG: hypothetical protein K1W35_04690, partial [Lachnospiraceae bacterium]